MKKKTAEFVSTESLKVIAALSSIVIKIQKESDPEEFEQMRKSIGIIVGKIQSDILDPICSKFPELDDLEK